MKVLIATGIFPPDAGGPAAYVPAFARALAGDHEVIGVVTLSDRLDHDDSSLPFPVVRIARNGNRLVRRIRTVGIIWRLLAKADVVYLNGLVLEGICAARIFRRKPTVIKVVSDKIWEQASAHRATDLGVVDFQRPGGKSMKWMFLRWLQSTYTRAATRVITPSRYLAALVAGWGIKDERVHVIPNAVQHDPDSAKDDMVPDHDVVTVARLLPLKRIGRLIEVCGRRGWSLLVVGDGPEREALEALAQSSPARVTFAGQVERAAVTSQMRRGRVFALNSTIEGLPHVVLEARLAGRPVVATAVGGTPETINDGVDGYLVPSGHDARLEQALARLLDDEDHCAFIAAAGRADALRRFTWEAMYRDTVDVLRVASDVRG